MGEEGGGRGEAGGRRGETPNTQAPEQQTKGSIIFVRTQASEQQTIHIQKDLLFLLEHRRPNSILVTYKNDLLVLLEQRRPNTRRFTR